MGLWANRGMLTLGFVDRLDYLFFFFSKLFGVHWFLFLGGNDNFAFKWLHIEIIANWIFNQGVYFPKVFKGSLPVDSFRAYFTLSAMKCASLRATSSKLLAPLLHTLTTKLPIFQPPSQIEIMPSAHAKKKYLMPSTQNYTPLSKSPSLQEKQTGDEIVQQQRPQFR